MLSSPLASLSLLPHFVPVPLSIHNMVMSPHKLPKLNLNFRKFKVALNPMYKIYLNFAKSYMLSCLLKFYNNKKITVPFLKYKHLKLKIRVFLAGHSVAMVTYCVTKTIPTCLPVIGQVFDTMIVASIDKEWLL